MCSQTREACSKVGRELLVSVANAHPFILSLLVQGTKDNMDTIGSVRKQTLINRGCYMVKRWKLIWFVTKTKDHLIPFVWIDPVLLKGDWLVSSIFDDILLIWLGLIYVRWLCTCSKHCHSTNGFHVSQTSLSSSNGWCHLTSPSLKTNSPGMSWASSTGELIKR